MDRSASFRRPLVPQLSSSPPPVRHLSTDSNESHTRKRRRTGRDASPGLSTVPPDSENEPIESIDLTEVESTSSLAKALAKQREDAIKAQDNGESEKGRSLLAAYKCPVCMDTPVDATTTVCGMPLFPRIAFKRYG